MFLCLFIKGTIMGVLKRKSFGNDRNYVKENILTDVIMPTLLIGIIILILISIFCLINS